MINLLDIVETDFLVYIIMFLVIILILILVYFLCMQSKNKYNEDIKSNVGIENEKIKEDSLNESKAINDTVELKTISKELESMSKEHKDDISMYESLQEETAIISYDELLSKTTKLDLDKLKDKDSNDIESNVIKEKENVDYNHEEKFLQDLKHLKDSIN